MDTVTPWYVPVARAVVALVAAAVVTFSADHSASVGYVTFGFFAVITGGILGFASLRSTGRGVVPVVTRVQSAVSLGAGIISLATLTAGLPLFVLLVAATAAITGFLELYLGLRFRGVDRSTRDWTFIGALTAVLAVVVVLVPPGFVQPFSGPDGVRGELTASVIIIGVLGAYWVVFGVYLVIAGLSLKWAPPSQSPTEATTESVSP
ncbi:MAG: hypothetical protein ACRCSP_02445 [Rhodoglobus sp.]